MGGIQMSNFSVHSSIHDYSVDFIDDTKATLVSVLEDGDILIVDNKILELYPDIFMNLNNKIINVSAKEEEKSYEGLVPIISNLIENGFKKNHKLIGIGGGITQDITAFISSIMYRGVQWILFPTTLLAQGDSCIGSKTSINFGQYKNQVGGFYPPNKIFLNVDFLKSLSIADIQSGLGEMCHYFIVSSYEDFIFFKDSYSDALKDSNVLKKIIIRSLEIKKSYIEIDEFDQNERQVFNYGHSFGHAIESLTHYKVPHGIAVSMGMDMANFISVKLGYISTEIRYEIRELLAKIWIGHDISKISINDFKIALSKDKKNVGVELRLILNKGYGKIFKTPMKMDDEFSSWLTEYFQNEVQIKREVVGESD